MARAADEWKEDEACVCGSGRGGESRLPVRVAARASQKPAPPGPPGSSWQPPRARPSGEAQCSWSRSDAGPGSRAGRGEEAVPNGQPGSRLGAGGGTGTLSLCVFTLSFGIRANCTVENQSRGKWESGLLAPCASPRGRYSLWASSLCLLALGLLAGRKDRYPGALPAGVSPAHDARSRLPSHCADDGQWSLSPFLPPSLSFLLSFNIACDYSP